MARDHDTPMAMLLFDIDDLKQINGSFGHQMGDDRLQRELRGSRFRQAGLEFTMGISQGLTMLQADDASVDDLYARADMAMYKAKLQGKNQIVVNADGG